VVFVARVDQLKRLFGGSWSLEVYRGVASFGTDLSVLFGGMFGLR